MYLRRLELQGFKTFAARTEFEFDSGITAIVGPNGSGKSNIADAIRWVLGEQSIRHLRAKRGEDLIFAGGHGRAPMGMAEVTLTLDNSEGWFPLSYSEVTITRRAYRSGENEYHANRQRARLRDVIDVLSKAKLGQSTYTIIGQGLVDSVLNQRPEERRELFEQAADISRYYGKLDETQSKLAATEQNVARANDIAAEIAPRLSSLERQARLAERRFSLAQELDTLQRLWYQHLLKRAQVKADEASAKESESRANLARTEERREAISRQLAAIREEELQTRSSLARWRQQTEPLRAEQEALAREIAIGDERQRAQAQQLDDLRQQMAVLEKDANAQGENLAAARDKLASLEAERKAATEAMSRLERELDDARQKTAASASSLGLLRASAFEVSASTVETERRLAQVRQRRQAIQRELRERDSAADQMQTQIREYQVKVEAIGKERDDLAAKLAAAQHRLQEIHHLVVESGRRQEQLSHQQEAQSRRKADLQTRYELISKWEDAQTGYFPGVRAVLQAAKARRDGLAALNGVVGIVGKVIRPEPRAEKAIEITLGGRVQDVIVERWQDAERAIEFLKRAGAGRATFLPLDTIRATPGQLPPRFGVLQPGQAPGGEILGVAADLVQFDRRFQAVVNLLLGRTIVVEDLQVARRLLNDCPAGWQIVTVDGELVRTSGAVTGGSVSQQSGVLGRIREMRDLPDEIGVIERQIAATHAALLAEKSGYRGLLAEQEGLEREERRLSSRSSAAREDLVSLERQLARARSDLQSHETHERELTVETERLADEEADGEAHLAASSSENAARSEDIQVAEADVARLRREEADLAASLTERRISLAQAEERQRSLLEALDRGEHALSSLRQQVEARRLRADQIEASRAALVERLAASRAKLEALAQELRQQAEQIGPAERLLGELAAQYNGLLQEDARLRVVEHEMGALHRHAELEAQRACDELEALTQRLRDEIGDGGLVFPRKDSDDRERALLDDWALRKVEDLKRRVDYLKSELRSLASVNPGAIDEYQELLDRHNFLTTQAEDLRRGAETLRQVIAELHKTMKRQFDETFKAVAEEFQIYFRALFGGGTARLMLTDPREFTQTGIDIVAQPPGKKQNNLALLSGGERALTGTALLFALLKVNPTPICVLDEVDAALDETNISRFCQALRGLAERTQFIIITHNRGTMEMANTLYGVSLIEGGASRIVSLRLSDVDGNGHYGSHWDEIKKNGKDENGLAKETESASSHGGPHPSPLPDGEGAANRLSLGEAGVA